MIKKGIAVGYSPGDPAPEVLAVARGLLAERMLEIARENDIIIYKDSDLAEVLSYMSPGSSVPEKFFRAVAEILAYCYRINDKFRQKLGAHGV